eukprot:5602726-Amphidinium_carterae.1
MSPMAACMRCSTRECRPRGLRSPSFSLLATTAAPLQSVTTTPCPCKRSQPRGSWEPKFRL